VPDPERGFVLANQLHEQAQVAGEGNGEGWEVVLDSSEGALLADLLSRIEHWLLAEDVEHADIYVDGTPYSMDAQ